jgi:hypothetical protein
MCIYHKLFEQIFAALPGMCCSMGVAGVFEYQEEEDQGLANQGKPSKLDAYLNPIYILLMFHNGLLKCIILYCYSSYSN